MHLHHRPGACNAAQTVYKLAYQRKLKLLREHGRLRSDTIWDRLVFDKIRMRLGGRVKGAARGA